MAFLRKNFKSLYEPERRRKEKTKLLNSIEFWNFKNDFNEIFEEFNLPEKTDILEKLKDRIYYEKNVWKWALNMQETRMSLVELLECSIKRKRPKLELLKSVVYDIYQDLNLAWLEAMIDNYKDFGTMLI